MFEMNDSQRLPVRGEVCIHLRSKSMYVLGQIKNPDQPESTGHCWCNLTQHVIGPDQHFVDRHSCLNGRDCFKNSY